MKLISILAVTLFLVSCATNQNTASNNTTGNTEATGARTPSAAGDLSGNYLGEGLFQNRTNGLKRPAMRIYLDRAPGEADTYYGAMVEYDQLLQMTLPYLASQKAPIFNHVVGYLNSISTRVWAFKVVPGPNQGTYLMYNLAARDGKIATSSSPAMMLNLDTKNIGTNNPLAGATITGYNEGQIVFPVPAKEDASVMADIGQVLKFTQYNLASVVYKRAHLASTWRGNWQDLEGSYLSEYGRVKDGVLELYSLNGQKRMKFIKTNRTKAKYFTNPKSGPLEGDYVVLEPIPKMYILVPMQRKNTPSDKELSSRIGMFLDVFDASAPEAGSHMVTEIAFTNPDDPEDFMMYYEHAEHLKNIGVEPPKK